MTHSSITDIGISTGNAITTSQSYCNQGRLYFDIGLLLRDSTTFIFLSNWVHYQSLCNYTIKALVQYTFFFYFRAMGLGSVSVKCLCHPQSIWQ